MNPEITPPQSRQAWLVESQTIVRAMSQRQLDAVLFALGHFTSGCSEEDKQFLWTPERVCEELRRALNISLYKRHD